VGPDSNLPRAALVRASVGSRHDRSRPIEQRLSCCDACGRTFVLSYERNGLGLTLASSVLAVVRVQCPWGHCGCVQGVLVPYEGRDVGVSVWLGQPRTVDRASKRAGRWPPR
jgi:hypothetical protein